MIINLLSSRFEDNRRTIFAKYILYNGEHINIYPGQNSHYCSVEWTFPI